MENARIPTPDYYGSDEGVWDRVQSLAPSSRPVGVPVFRQTRAAVARASSPHSVQASLVKQPSAPEDLVPKTTTWSGLRIATPERHHSLYQAGPTICQDRADPVMQAFDQLRTRLLQTLSDNGWSRVAIAAPSAGCGATFTACNLAISLSRMASVRTVLFDLNLRAPGVANTFRLHNTVETRRFLRGNASASSYLVRYCDNLALGLTQARDDASAELLHDPRTAATLERLEQSLRPDVMLFDLPPVLAYDDAAVFLPHVDGVLLVADATKTVATQIAQCQRVISGQTKLLGVILNNSSEQSGASLGYAHG